MEKDIFFNRDLSWLGFNERVLTEAKRPEVPLLERIKFLSIYSSNLDEFYRVRMPVLMAINNLTHDPETGADYLIAKSKINAQQEEFGRILAEEILPDLEKNQISLVYNQPFPSVLNEQAEEIFRKEIWPALVAVDLEQEGQSFFAQNNKLYQAVVLANPEGKERLELINIPSDVLPRFYRLENGGKKYVVFIEDIIKRYLGLFFSGSVIVGAYNLKITRDAELRLEEEVDADMVAMMEKELAKRDLGLATRFLCQPGIPLRYLYKIIYSLKLEKASVVEGGVYHNLKDLNDFPLEDPSLEYPKWPALERYLFSDGSALYRQIEERDLMVHVPYESYQPVLGFFKEAAADPEVEEIYCTLYRVANQSEIVAALITAAQNGKKVSVMLELKARFDEANNLKWAAQMKIAGVKIIYSSISFKVHAKVALIKRRGVGRNLGLLATGNLNETTARFYTDHILLTANQAMLKELELLFGFLAKKKKRPAKEEFISFEHLLVAQFNLQTKFLELIDREIENFKKGLPAGIRIKLNNLEERTLISKLYEASRAGVKIELLVRSICCLIPGVPGMSENITVKRIVDRYLEHGRVFIFHNNGEEAVFLGSADWMNRNVYSRIEVCFPLYDLLLKKEITDIINLQLADHVQAVQLDVHLNNIPLHGSPASRSQEAIYQLLKQKQVRQLQD